MQIHELNNFTGTLGSGSYLAIDDGNDTGKISKTQLFAATEARIDNIIAGPAPSAEEIVDARLGDDGVTYPSLGDAIRDQFSDVKSEISEVITVPVISKWIEGEYIKKTDGTVGTSPTYHRTDYIEIDPTLGAISFTNVDGGGGYDTDYNAWYDESKTFIAPFSTVKNKTIKIQPPLTAKYMRLSFNSTQTNTISVDYIHPAKAQADYVNGNANLYRHESSVEDFRNGIWNDNSVPNYTDTTRLCNISPIKVNKGDVVTISSSDTSWRYALKLFGNPPPISQTALDASTQWLSADTKVYYVCPQSGYLVFNIKVSNDATITPNDCKIHINSPAYGATPFQNTTEANFTWNGLSEYVRGKFNTKMSHRGDGTYEWNNTRNAIIQPLKFDFDVIVTVASGYRFALQYFDGYEIGSSHLTYAGPWVTTYAVIPKGTYFCMIVAYTNDAETDSTTQDNLTFSAMTNAEDAYYRLMPMWDDYFAKASGDYVIGAGFERTGIRLKRIGMVQGRQSFCKYDTKFFSTDGSNLYEQDSALNVISTTSMNLGHGNGLQLGSNGVAYASGWDDSTIYVVNLTSKAIVTTITLPVSGYTTCAVDDVNGLIYIFQRTSLPNTRENYSFIVFDYVNDNIISTKKTSRAFGAMQSCDFFDGKIFVLYGLGTSAVPNGYAVFNTNGDIISEYKIGTQETKEPEGVAVDRDNLDVYLSYDNGFLYKIESV